MRTYRSNTIDLSNSDSLDEGFSNMVSKRQISNFTKESQSDFTNESLLDGLTENTSLLEAEGGSYVSPEMIQASIGVTTAIASGIQAKKGSPAGQSKAELKAVCGRKPFLFPKKKKAYQDCVNAYLKSKQASTPTPTTPTTTDFQRGMNSQGGSTSDGKILGMPKGLAIGLGVAVLALGVFVTVKLIKARKG